MVCLQALSSDQQDVQKIPPLCNEPCHEELAKLMLTRSGACERLRLRLQLDGACKFIQLYVGHLEPFRARRYICEAEQRSFFTWPQNQIEESGRGCYYIVSGLHRSCQRFAECNPEATRPTDRGYKARGKLLLQGDPSNHSKHLSMTKMFF